MRLKDAPAWGKLPATERSALLRMEGEGLDPRQGVASAAAAGQLGDFFQYVIEHPVNLLRQKSALLPIVNKDVEATRVSIYNQNTHAKFPLLGLRFKNTTGLHLMQGPITVFEGSSYAGDSRVLDLQPNEERLLSYAIDLGTEVEPVAQSDANRIINVRISKGILWSTTKTRDSKTYNVKNRSEHDRTVLIEQPFRADFKLVSKDAPAERTREVYRFAVKVPAGKAAKLDVVEERDHVLLVALIDQEDQAFHHYAGAAASSPKVKEALHKALEVKGRVATTQRELLKVQQELTAITEDQARLRANLKEMPQTAAAYKRYLNKFDTQETEIEKLQTNIKELQQAIHQHRKDYEAFLLSIEVQ